MNLFKFFFVFFFAFFVVQDVYSYIDPGTGAYLIQILIAIFAGALYFVKVFWLQIKNFLALMNKKIRTLFGK